MIKNIIRRPAVSDRLGIQKSTTYDHVSKSLIPPPIQIGPRAVAWISSEIDAIISARIAGKDEAAIKALVGDLMAARQSAA